VPSATTLRWTTSQRAPPTWPILLVGTPDERATVSSTGRIDVSHLRQSVHGLVMLPGDDGYASARAVWNAMVDRRPALAVR
jgi:hypothetical protein